MRTSSRGTHCAQLHCKTLQTKTKDKQSGLRIGIEAGYRGRICSEANVLSMSPKRLIVFVEVLSLFFVTQRVQVPRYGCIALFFRIPIRVLWALCVCHHTDTWVGGQEELSSRTVRL